VEGEAFKADMFWPPSKGAPKAILASLQRSAEGNPFSQNLQIFEYLSGNHFKMLP
jgi:hypothetical protein